MTNCKLPVESVEQLTQWLDAYWATVSETMKNYNGGLMLGIRAQWYAPLLAEEKQLVRCSDHALVFSVDCDWHEEEEIMQKLKPVDHYRRGNTLIVVCYNPSDAGRVENYRTCFREERLKSHKERVK